MKLLPRIPLLTPKVDPAQQWASDERELLHRAAKIGGEVFGPIPDGHRREFFCLDQNTWYWHEEWLDTTGARQVVTTRYDVRQDTILKSQGQQMYQPLTHEEAKNLQAAAHVYKDRVGAMCNELLQAG